MYRGLMNSVRRSMQVIIICCRALQFKLSHFIAGFIRLLQILTCSTLYVCAFVVCCYNFPSNADFGLLWLSWKKSITFLLLSFNNVNTPIALIELCITQALTAISGTTLYLHHENVRNFFDTLRNIPFTHSVAVFNNINFKEKSVLFTHIACCLFFCFTASLFVFFDLVFNSLVIIYNIIQCYLCIIIVHVAILLDMIYTYLIYLTDCYLRCCSVLANVCELIIVKITNFLINCYIFITVLAAVIYFAIAPYIISAAIYICTTLCTIFTEFTNTFFFIIDTIIYWTYLIVDTLFRFLSRNLSSFFQITQSDIDKIILDGDDLFESNKDINIQFFWINAFLVKKSFKFLKNFVIAVLDLPPACIFIYVYTIFYTVMIVITYIFLFLSFDLFLQLYIIMYTVFSFFIYDIFLQFFSYCFLYHDNRTKMKYFVDMC